MHQYYDKRTVYFTFLPFVSRVFRGGMFSDLVSDVEENLELGKRSEVFFLSPPFPSVPLPFPSLPPLLSYPLSSFPLALPSCLSSLPFP